MASIDLVNLKPGTSYSVQVQAVGSNGTDLSDWSTTYTFVTPGLPSGTTNTAQSMQLGSGSMIFAGNPAPGALLTSGNANTGNSALVMSNNTFQALKADGSTPLFKLDVNADTMIVNASNFNLDTSGNVKIGNYFNYSGSSGNLTIGSSGNAVTVDAVGNVVISGTLTAGSVYVNSDYWTSSGFQLGGGNGISYLYATDTVVIGNSSTGITINNAGGITLGSDATFNGNITSLATITGATITGSDIQTSTTGNRILISQSIDALQFLEDTTVVGNISTFGSPYNGVVIDSGTYPDTTFTGSSPAVAVFSGGIDLYHNPGNIGGSAFLHIGSLGVSMSGGTSGVVNLQGDVVLGKSTASTTYGLKRIISQNGGTASGGNDGDIIFIY